MDKIVLTISYKGKEIKKELEVFEVEDPEMLAYRIQDIFLIDFPKLNINLWNTE